ncbi:MAG TPA: NAD(P)H-hydrate dehydratase, partial [Stenomitos sp.]
LIAILGSGDVLTGLVGSLMAQAIRHQQPLEGAVQCAVWWHAYTGCWAAEQNTILGVNAETLAESLLPALMSLLDRPGF